jgi:SAM-dependent methyltransferase
MPEHTNLDEYLYPDLYDLENPKFEPEGPFYLEMALAARGPILELGCGTGRVTIPLAQHGLDITGLDVAPTMLALARAKSAGLPIEWVQADVRSFRLRRRFSLIFESGGVFMHMLTRTDQQAFLARVREHLAPGGRFIVAVLFPHPHRLQSSVEEKEWFTYADREGRTVRVSGTDAYDALRQVKTETAIRRVLGQDGVEMVRIAPLSLRYTFPQEMEGLLMDAGFAVVQRYGGPDRRALANDSEYMVFVCTSA